MFLLEIQIIFFLRHLTPEQPPQTLSPYEIWKDFGDFKTRDINFRLLKAIFTRVKNIISIVNKSWSWKVEGRALKTALRHLTWWKWLFFWLGGNSFLFFLFFFFSLCCFHLWKCEQLRCARMWMTKVKAKRMVKKV